MKKYSVVLIIIALFLSACAIKAPEKTIYTLTDTSHPGLQNLHKRETLLISVPTTNPGYETKNMLYTLKPYELASFSTHQWAGPPAKMLFPLLIQHIDNTGDLQAAVSPPLSAYRHKLLKTHLIEFHQDFTMHPSVIRMTLRADIIEKAKDQVISTQVFTIEKPTTSDTPYGGVIAFNEATHILLDQVAWYCVQHLIAHPILLPPPGKFNSGDPS